MRVMAMSLILGLALSASARAADLKVGDPAPNFKLQATDGKTYQLSDFKGKKAVVVAWFPAAFTRGCTIECKSLAENGDKIKMYDVSYFMASVDPLEKNIEFAKALINDPKMKREIAQINKGLRPKMSLSLPYSGVVMVLVIKYAVVTHA